jgi:hypothetical protein
MIVAAPLASNFGAVTAVAYEERISIGVAIVQKRFYAILDFVRLQRKVMGCAREGGI